MVDKGFLVDNLVPVKVYWPASSSKSDQTSAHDVTETQPIAPGTVHVEKLFRRAHENRLFDTNITLSISGSINQL